MLQELTANTGAQPWAIVSTLFFFAIFFLVALRVLTRKRGTYDARARLPLDEVTAAVDSGDAPAEEGK